MMQSEWFKDWFNSPYYHLLYNNRDENEAQIFINNLCEFLKLPPNSRVWDLACGKGRHAIHLNKRGYNVTGTDLSLNSIIEAAKHNNATLDFFVHDMRVPFRINYFDAVFNLFTSIGYFKNNGDMSDVFNNVCKSLKRNGVFLIDFFNAEKIEKNYVPQSYILKNNIQFNIQKKIENNKIVKRIEFADMEKNYYFEETVTLLKMDDFKTLAQNSDLQIQHVFGDYQLQPFDSETSDRLILILKKS
jgi:SAM-dependent methyltransferase